MRVTVKYLRQWPKLLYKCALIYIKCKLVCYLLFNGSPFAWISRSWHSLLGSAHFSFSFHIRRPNMKTSKSRRSILNNSESPDYYWLFCNSDIVRLLMSSIVARGNGLSFNLSVHIKSNRWRDMFEVCTIKPAIFRCTALPHNICTLFKVFIATFLYNSGLMQTLIACFRIIYTSNCAKLSFNLYRPTEFDGWAMSRNHVNVIILCTIQRFK